MLARRSIRLRLTVWYVVVLAVVLAAFSAGVYITLRHNLSSNLNDTLDNRTTVLLGAVDYEDGRPTLAGSVSPFSPNADDYFVRVYNADGQLTFSSVQEGTISDVDIEKLRLALDGGSGSGSGDVNGDPMRVRYAPIEEGGALEVGVAEDDVTDTLRILLYILAIAYPATLVVASAGGIFLAGRALSPIDRITKLAQRISAEDLSQRLDLDIADDEVGRLARTFDDMIARLDAAFRRQRQFTADASHELRTPLTAVRGQIEVALSREREGDAYREVLQGVNEEVDRLIRLVGSLLTLARADAGEIALASEPVDLGELAGSAVEQVRQTAEQKHIDLTVEGGAGVVVQADQDLLLQLVLNLLDNALKFTADGGAVTVGWASEGELARLSVRDTGLGIAPEHIGRIFDRFYRVDTARSRAEGGAGLGLSISRWIAEAHGGRLAVESSPGSGSTFTVTLPGRAVPAGS